MASRLYATAINILNSNIVSLTVVTGFDEEEIVNALNGLTLILSNPDLEKA